MQVAANHRLVRNRSRLAWALYLGAMGIFFVGLVSSNRDPGDPSSSLVPWISISVGMLLWFTSLSQLRRWGPRHRQDRLLAAALSDLDDRYKLYSFISSRLPDFIVVGPGGVYSLVTRSEGGTITCLKDRWKKGGASVLTAVFGNPFGNPSYDAQEQVRRLRRLLDEGGMQHVPAGSMIVFTNDRAKPRVEGCSYPVARLKALKETVLRQAGKGKSVALTSAQVREVRALFDLRLESAHAWR